MQFNLTPRMAWIAVFCLVSLLALMFGIGLMIGRTWTPPSGQAARPALSTTLNSTLNSGLNAYDSAKSTGSAAAARLQQPALATPGATLNTLHD